MFSDCFLLTTLDLSSFNTDSVKFMSEMFSGCRSLTSLDLSNFNTTNVSAMYYMFQDCQSLTTLDLSSFSVNKEESDIGEDMFKNCGLLTNGEPAKGFAIDKATADFFNSTSNTGIDPSRLVFAESTNTESINAESNITAFAIGNSIVVNAPINTQINILNTAGVLIKSFVANSETTTINNLPSAVYIVNNKKVIVE